MLNITPSKNAVAGIEYFTESLSKADYYLGEAITPTFEGKLAIKLGIAGVEITKNSFEDLCYNKNPKDGQLLNDRKLRNDRKPFYDFTFSAPKSFSILHILHPDQKVKDNCTYMFDLAVKQTMEKIEKDYSITRHQDKKAQSYYNYSSNLAYLRFNHEFSRPVDGIPDPHTHCHTIIFNTTYDPIKKDFRAIEFHDAMQDKEYLEAIFHSNLAQILMTNGITLRQTHKSFEINSISDMTIAKFSNRTSTINNEAKEKGLDAKKKGELGAKSRESKNKVKSTDEIFRTFTNRLAGESSIELKNFKNIQEIVKDNSTNTLEITNIYTNTNTNNTELLHRQLLNNSINHFLETTTVIKKEKLIGYALANNLLNTQEFDLSKSIEQEKASKKMISKKLQNKTYITTSQVLKEEELLTKHINSSKNKKEPINEAYRLQNSMSKDQDKVFYEIMQSTDSIKYIKGDAGTGKTYLIQNLKIAIEESNKKVFAYAPTSIAGKEVLRNEVTKDADTIAMLLVNKDIQAKLNNQSVVFLDESGMVGYQDMIKLFELQEKHNFDLILVGDTKQHTAVARGEALKYIENYTDIKTLCLTDNRRQKDNIELKEAIDLLATGQVEDSFSKLDNLNLIHEIKDDDKRNTTVAKDYMTTIKESKNWNETIKKSLVVTPTHKENLEVTKMIRQELKDNKVIKGKEINYEILVDKRMSKEEKKNVLNYQKSDILVFSQNAKGFIKGQEIEVNYNTTNNKYFYEVKNYQTKKIEKLELPITESERFNVFRKEQIKLAKGDFIRMTKNGMTENNERLNNNQRYQIEKIQKNENGNNEILLSNGFKLKSDFKSINYGYAQTSNTAQGTTVNNCFYISSTSLSQRVGSYEGVYVGLSRTKNKLNIYTDNKEELLKTATNEKIRITATELNQPEKSILKDQKSISKSHVKKLGKENIFSKKYIVKNDQINTKENTVKVLSK